VKVYDLQDHDGQTVGLEVSSTLGRRRAARVAGGIPGVRILRWPRRWALTEPDDFCVFDLEGVRFVISEPFGDNSRFWIGPQPVSPVPQLARVRAAFDEAPVLPIPKWPAFRSAMAVLIVMVVGVVLAALTWGRPRHLWWAIPSAATCLVTAPPGRRKEALSWAFGVAAFAAILLPVAGEGDRWLGIARGRPTFAEADAWNVSVILIWVLAAVVSSRLAHRGRRRELGNATGHPE
jgi:hypothetical protein